MLSPPLTSIKRDQCSSPLHRTQGTDAHRYCRISHSVLGREEIAQLTPHTDNILESYRVWKSLKPSDRVTISVAVHELSSLYQSWEVISEFLLRLNLKFIRLQETADNMQRHAGVEMLAEGAGLLTDFILSIEGENEVLPRITVEAAEGNPINSLILPNHDSHAPILNRRRIRLLLIRLSLR